MNKLTNHFKQHNRKYLFGTMILILGFLSMLYLPSNNIKTYADFPGTGNLILDMDFEHVSGNMVYDSSPLNNTGTLTGIDSIAVVDIASDHNGINNQALVLQGNGDNLAIPNFPTLGHVTVSVWIKLTACEYHNTIASQVKNLLYISAGYGQNGGPGNCKLSLYYTNGGRLASPANIMLNTWTHIAVSWNGTTNKIYINGNLVGSEAGSAPNAGPDNNTFYIGLRPDVPSVSFSGLIDDFKVYNTALSDSEISTLVMPDPISEYKFDSCVGTSAIDSIGGNNGTITGAKWMPGYHGQGLNFNGEADQVILPPSSRVGDMTVSLWIKKNGEYGFAPLVEQGGANAFRFILARAGTKLCFGYDTEQNNFYCSQDINLGSNEWHFVTATYTGSTVAIYLDGQALTITQFASEYGSVGTDNLYIGYRTYNYNVKAFSGTIDEVRIYDTALSESGVMDLYNSYGSESSIECEIKSYISGYVDQSDRINVKLGKNIFTNAWKSLVDTIQTYESVFVVKNDLGRPTAGDKLMTPFGFRAPVPDGVASGENATVNLKVKFFNLGN